MKVWRSCAHAFESVSVQSLRAHAEITGLFEAVSRVKSYRIGPIVGGFALLTIGAGCTQYQPVDVVRGQSWQQARQAPYDGRFAAADGHYVVMTGDTVSEIAQRFGLTMGQVVSLNGLSDADHIFAGQVLRVQRGSASQGPVYLVRRGDNLSTIAALHGTSTAELMRANPGVVPSRLAVGSQLSLPDRKTGSTRTVVAAAAPPSPAPMPQQVAKAPTRPVLTEAQPPTLSGYGFVWPVSGPVVSEFGRYPNGVRNDGINISAPVGTAVRAAENGIVIYAGEEIKALGRMLLVRHEGDYLTTYAHLDEIRAEVGERVQRGQTIATVGRSGRVDSPQLHFQLRVGTEPLDPSRHLLEETTVASR